MGSFANSVFRVLLGWVRTVAQNTWSLINGEAQTGFAAWFVQNWVKLFLLLCLIGLIIDFVIYMIRWQPYKVWKSFFTRHRLKNKDIAEDHAESEQEYAVNNEEQAHEAYEYSFSIRQNQSYTEETGNSGNTEKFSKAIQPGRRRRRVVSELFSDGNIEEQMIPPDSLIDSDEAYYMPVYPKNWKGSGEQPDHGQNI